MNDDKKYEEVGNVYRFFLGWRHASFAGNLLVMYGAASLTLLAYKDARSLAWLVPLAASPIGVLFWWIDVRTRDLYHAAIAAGKALEGDGSGFYHQLADVAVPRGSSVFSRATQSGALSVFFLGSSAVLFAVGLALLWLTFCRCA